MGLRVATGVSYLISPLALPPLVYGSVLVHVGAPWADVVWGAGVGGVFLGLVPLAYVGGMWAQGRVASLEIRTRARRTEPFLVALGAGTVALAAVLSTDMVGRQLLAALVGCHVLNTALLSLITTRWKISVHCASVTGAVATLVFVQAHVPGTLLPTGPGVLAAGIGGVALVLWARIRTRAHTPLQAVAGTGLGLAPYAELLILAQGVGL